ncbi:MAG TPA: tRNA 2-thiouridine(34) synthase MnmA [Candidatus Paceibacterota bacterium]|jgi:tRNA-specific 2-thiouridylase|nr:tRNA 2-thiouridine(34) synthase MnmA [Candidatus Paceibacterota bacterium]
MESLAGKKVFVGLSGGVDSAVSAALLQRAGANVTGIFIKGWYPPGMPCTWAADRRDAMRIAAHLGIPFHTLDASAEYKKGVIEYLRSEYAAGRTPNPDIMCNREVKFGAFYQFAKEHGADFIATGHYARAEGGRLLRGIDEAKDQSYFLWAIPKEALARSLFPVGGMPKSAVRVLAQKFDIPVAEKKDSQGICFLGSISVDEFLRQEFGTKQGAAIDEAGKEVGTHDGAVLHTLGARIALADAAPGPWYVMRKDVQANILTVRHGSAETGQTVSAIRLHEENFFEEIPDAVEAQYRYHGPRIAGAYDRSAHAFIPAEPLREPVASGQSLVLYAGDACIGGGIIE